MARPGFSLQAWLDFAISFSQGKTYHIEVIKHKIWSFLFKVTFCCLLYQNKTSVIYFIFVVIYICYFNLFPLCFVGIWIMEEIWWEDIYWYSNAIDSFCIVESHVSYHLMSLLWMIRISRYRISLFCSNFCSFCWSWSLSWNVLILILFSLSTVKYIDWNRLDWWWHICGDNTRHKLSHLLSANCSFWNDFAITLSHLPIMLLIFNVISEWNAVKMQNL